MDLTAPRITDDLWALGVASGGVLMVHASLSAMGPVEGGAPTVVDALMAALGPQGTLVMPAFINASVSLDGIVETAPKWWADKARETWPDDPATAPSEMGAITEALRQRPGTRRSAHPTTSVIAAGPQAGVILEPHPVAWATGTASPFARMTEMDAQMLLLGVGFNRLSLLHHAEGLIPHGRRKTRLVPEGDHVLAIPDVGDDLNTHFPAIGQAFLATGQGRMGRIGLAESVLVSAGRMVPFAAGYLSAALAMDGTRARP
ncbi:MAG: AAC(3) family N-acetyltransferase [Pseudomonadota bacterium]